jgi:hypothetical protein
MVSEAKESDGCQQHVQTLLVLLVLLGFLLLTRQMFWAGVLDGGTVEEVRTFCPFALSETMETSV